MTTALVAIGDNAVGSDADIRRVDDFMLDPRARLALVRIHVQTRWAVSVSAVLHALLLLWVVVLWRPAPEIEPLTEITYIEPGDLASPALAKAVASAAPSAAPGELKRGEADVHFRRDSRESDVSFDPQSSAALEDRLNARLAALQGTAGPAVAGAAASAPASLWGTAPATVSGSGAGGPSPAALKRGGGGAAPAPALELTRGGRDAPAPALVATPTPAERQAPAPARSSEGAARRTIGGVTLIGPIADRAILSHPTPVYPEWAKRDAVEGSVTLYFVVRADGTVKENILVQKTAGFEDFDEAARAALSGWRFEPLRDGTVGEQWGNITFHFRLRGGA